MIISLDGIGAYDHIRWAEMLAKLGQLPQASAMLPNGRLFYASTSRLWRDADGVEHEILQAEGGEQGDPLMSALFALGQHEALHEAASLLSPDDTVLTYLDDLYIVQPSTPLRGPFIVALAFRPTWANWRFGALRGERRRLGSRS